MTSSCAGPFGAVSPLLRPSWLTAVPRMTAEDAVAGGARIAQPLQHDDAAAFGADVAVGRRVERLAAAVGRHHPGLREGDRQLGREDHVDAAGQRRVALALAQAAARQVHGDERRGARRVDRQARPVRAEDVRQPAARRAERVAGAAVHVHAFGARQELQPRVVVRADADEDARRRAGEAIRGDPRVLERLPGDFEQRAAAADPWPRLRAARCRRTADRTGRSRRGTRRTAS